MESPSLPKSLAQSTFFINNGAIQPYGTVASTEPEQRDVFHVNLRGAYSACRHALPHMPKKGRRSDRQFQLSAGASQSSACSRLCKLESWANRSDAINRGRFRRFGARANSVCPGCIDAPMTRFSAATIAPGCEDEIIREWRKAQPLGRVGRSEEGESRCVSRERSGELLYWR
jgi:NAD(P)-dependent dehydrogenase (short-subunit alcohol dehydrogenase family)